MKRNQTHRMMHVAILSALSVVLMFFDFPLPFFPPFLKLDASDAVIFISSTFVGSWGMLAIIFLRSLLHWFLRGAETGVPVGQLATIISSVAFCHTAFFVAQKMISIKNLQGRSIIGLFAGTVVMTVVMFIVNYFWVIPFYFSLAQLPLPANYAQYMLIYIPFNLIKGFINSLIIYLLLPYTLRKNKCELQRRSY